MDLTVCSSTSQKTKMAFADSDKYQGLSTNLRLGTFDLKPISSFFDKFNLAETKGYSLTGIALFVIRFRTLLAPKMKLALSYRPENNKDQTWAGRLRGFSRG
ncbi:MAG: hypothetical protein P8130_14835 [Deltaproteobacteria bacterium]